MDEEIILKLVIKELHRAEKEFPYWFGDPIHASNVVAEEAGELVRAANIFSYEDGLLYTLKEEAIQTAAMAIRFLKHIDKYSKIQYKI